MLSEYLAYNPGGFYPLFMFIINTSHLCKFSNRAKKDAGQAHTMSTDADSHNLYPNLWGYIAILQLLLQNPQNLKFNLEDPDSRDFFIQQVFIKFLIKTPTTPRKVIQIVIASHSFFSETPCTLQLSQLLAERIPVLSPFSRQDCKAHLCPPSRPNFHLENSTEAQTIINTLLYNAKQGAPLYYPKHK